MNEFEIFWAKRYRDASIFVSNKDDQYRIENYDHNLNCQIGQIVVPGNKIEEIEDAIYLIYRSAKELRFPPDRTVESFTIGHMTGDRVIIFNFNEKVFFFNNEWDDCIQAIKHHVKLKKTAYYLWEEAGKPNSRDLEFWESAEKL